MVFWSTKYKKGIVLVVTMCLMALMVLSTVFLSTMVRQDVNIMKMARDRQLARYVAEAGINQAFARIKKSGFASRANFNANMDTGSYTVTYGVIGVRYLVTSVGKVSGVSETVTAEIKDNTATALADFSTANNNIEIYSFVANAIINGDIHANNEIDLISGPLIAHLYVTGRVSATTVVCEGTDLHSDDIWDNHVYINGLNDDTAAVYESQPRKTFPTFNYSLYQTSATSSGYYYGADHTFNNATLSPSGGVAYVNGVATFTGTCTLNGGIVANSISVSGTLTQNESGTKNVIIAKSGNIGVLGTLHVNKALVYASQDVIALLLGAELNVTGTMMAGRDINMWNVLTTITYDYSAVSPDGVLSTTGGDAFGVVSWNK